MFCKNCGQEIADGSVVCPICNQAVNAAPAAAAKKVNVFAIIGMVVSLLSFVILLFINTYVGLAGSIAAIVVSAIGISKAKKTNSGRGMAITGLVFGIIGVVLFILLVTVLAVLLAGIYGAAGAF